jgi:hypothetical protein
MFCFLKTAKEESLMKQRKLLVWNAVLIGLFFIISLTACLDERRFDSPDHRFKAEKFPCDNSNKPPILQEEANCYLVREIKTQKIVFYAHPQRHSDFPGVKVQMFSDDSKKWAAYYHYGDRDDEHSQYTWIGVWSTETGELLYSREDPGWIQIPSKFPEPQHPRP